MKLHGNQCVSRGKIMIIHVLAGMVLSLIFGLIFGYFVMLLWNNLLPAIFGWKEITYWQGAGLVIMFRLLFGSHGYYKSGHDWEKAAAAAAGPAHRSMSERDGYYRTWWEQEGRAAFQQYADKRDNQDKQLK